jgi:mRNA interferase RelE/StbE
LTKTEFTVEWAKGTKKDLQAINKGDVAKIFAAVDLLRTNPRPAKMKRLVASENQFRVRVGDYRIIYQVEDSRLVILVIRIAHRRDVYRNLN